MRAKTVVPATLVAVGLVLLTAWLFAWPVQKAMVLAPIIVVAVGAAAGVVVLWTRVLTESLRKSAHPRRVVAIAVGAFFLILALSALGVTLPRE